MHFAPGCVIPGVCEEVKRARAPGSGSTKMVYNANNHLLFAPSVCRAVFAVVCFCAVCCITKPPGRSLLSLVAIMAVVTVLRYMQVCMHNQKVQDDEWACLCRGSISRCVWRLSRCSVTSTGSFPLMLALFAYLLQRLPTYTHTFDDVQTPFTRFIPFLWAI